MGCVLALGFLLATPAEGRVRGEGRQVPVALAPAAMTQSLDPTGVEAYWTADRMQKAQPLGLDEVGDLIKPRAAAPRSTSRATALTSPRSVGKLFFTTPEGNAVCSAAAVNSAAKNLIITAAHCAHSGMPKPCGLLRTCPGQYYTNFLFVPRYANGTAPDGKWVGTRAFTHSQWVSDEDLAFDQALIQVAPRAGWNLVNVVGGNGVAWNYPLREDRVGVWGWPAESPYDGQTVRKCAGSTTVFSGGDAKIPCPLTGGASGGPWFISMTNANVGYIWAVTSRRTTSGTPYLIADPFGNEIKTLFSSARTNTPARAVAAPTPAPVPASRVTTRAALIPLVATPTLVQRGQLVRLRARTSARTRTYLSVKYSASGAWHRIGSKVTDRYGVVVYGVRPSRVGVQWFRVRTATRKSGAVGVRVVACPLPLDRSLAVVSATGCTQPVG